MVLYQTEVLDHIKLLGLVNKDRLNILFHYFCLFPFFIFEIIPDVKKKL